MAGIAGRRQGQQEGWQRSSPSTSSLILRVPSGAQDGNDVPPSLIFVLRNCLCPSLCQTHLTYSSSSQLTSSRWFEPPPFPSASRHPPKGNLGYPVWWHKFCSTFPSHLSQHLNFSLVGRGIPLQDSELTVSAVKLVSDDSIADRLLFNKDSRKNGS